MGIKKKIIKVGSVILLIITIGTSIFVYRYNAQKNEAINLVKGLTSKINPATDLEEAYGKYFTKLDYIYYKTSDGDEIVSLRGRKHFKDRDKICDVEINYIVDTKTGNLTFKDAFIDESRINEIEVLKMKIIAFRTVDSKTI